MKCVCKANIEKQKHTYDINNNNEINEKCIQSGGKIQMQMQSMINIESNAMIRATHE